MRMRKRDTKKARIEIIPMIDTPIFFLLFFFMISTLSMSRYSGLPVNLPKAATGQQTPSESAAVTIASDGTIAIDKQDVARAQVGEILKARLTKSPGLLVLINADVLASSMALSSRSWTKQGKSASLRWPSLSSPRKAAVRNDRLGGPFLASLSVHLLAILLGSVIFQHNNAHLRDFLPIDLVD